MELTLEVESLKLRSRVLHRNPQLRSSCSGTNFSIHHAYMQPIRCRNLSSAIRGPTRL